MVFPAFGESFDMQKPMPGHVFHALGPNTPYFIILLGLMPGDLYSCQGESAGAQCGAPSLLAPVDPPLLFATPE